MGNFGRSPLAEIYDGPEMLRVFTGVPEVSFNSVLRAHLSSERADEAIAAAVAYFAAKRTQWSWLVGTEPQPPDLEQRLEAHGLQRRIGGMGMGIDLEAVNVVQPTAGLEIVRLDSGKMLDTFVSVYVTVFEMSDAVREPMTALERSIGCGPKHPYRRFLGLVGGKAVATTAVFLGESVAGVYLVSTLPTVRGQGIGTTMTRRALLEAREAGYRVAVLHASDAGARIYKALGFKLGTELREYLCLDGGRDCEGVHGR
jgi:ribosomal protein S18 acetylase RimI-like enzyme